MNPFDAVEFAPTQNDAAADRMVAMMRSVCVPAECVECGQPVAPRSCYCVECENAIYAE